MLFLLVQEFPSSLSFLKMLWLPQVCPLTLILAPMNSPLCSLLASCFLLSFPLLLMHSPHRVQQPFTYPTGNKRLGGDSSCWAS